MRFCILGTAIFCLVLGIFSGCSTAWKPDNLKNGMLKSLSLNRKDSDSTTELERRADQLVRIQEYAAAEDLYSEILHREPKNETVQQKLTDLQWKKRGVSETASRQAVAAKASHRVPLDSQRPSSHSPDRPSRAASTVPWETGERVVIARTDESAKRMLPKTRVAASSIKPIDRSFEFDSNRGGDRTPEWARDDAIDAELTALRRNHAQPTSTPDPRPKFQERTPQFEATAPSFPEEPIRREPLPRSSGRPVAQQTIPPRHAAPRTQNEEWTIAVTPKSRSQQSVHFGTPQPPGVIDMKRAAPRALDSNPWLAPATETPAIASVREHPQRYNPAVSHPDSAAFETRTPSSIEPLQREPRSAPSAAVAKQLSGLSDTELQEIVLTQPQDSAAINEVFQRLGSPNQATRWQAANTIEVLAIRPESEEIILAGFARTMSDSDPVLREQALRVLRGMPEQSNQLRTLIQTRLDDRNEHVRSAAANALRSSEQ